MKLIPHLSLIIGGSLIVAGMHAQAQPITVPNYSFESQIAPTSYPYVNTFIDSWQKAPEPAYYGPAIGVPFGIPWDGTAGVFHDTNPYANHDGIQAGYILGFPGVTLYQDYNSSPTHDFNATYDVGQSYTMTIGVFGKSTLAPGSTFELSLYYLDGANNHVVVDSTTITYSADAFPTTGTLSLVDYQVTVPTVMAGDAWAGQHMGIQLTSTSPIELATGGNWDFDNVRLMAVPEPGTMGLMAIGGAAAMYARRRKSKT